MEEILYYPYVLLSFWSPTLAQVIDSLPVSTGGRSVGHSSNGVFWLILGIIIGCYITKRSNRNTETITN